MPVIHAPLNDDDFVDLSNMARAKGMTRSALASYILIAEIRKATTETPMFETRDDAIKFNAQGLPLAAKLKLSEVPVIPQYERQ
jgi:hypothetical protein